MSDGVRGDHPALVTTRSRILVSVLGNFSHRWRIVDDQITGRMVRTNIDIDDEACAAIMRRYRLVSKREAVNLALRTLAAGPLSLAAARRLRGSGSESDLEAMCGSSAT